MEIVKYHLNDLNEIYQVLSVSEILYLAVNGDKYPKIYSMLYGLEKRDDHIILYFMDDKKSAKGDVLK
jgi:nitroimidazol reductase NimA-like FMN-containing flavoprotein (pyridoxamine 5'-phosphate oxidase superfamily)